MSRFLRASATALLLLAATSAFAQPIKLQYKFTPGEIDKYKLAIAVTLAMPQMQGKSIPPMNFAMTMTTTQKTLGVLPDGSAKVRMKLFGTQDLGRSDAAECDQVDQAGG